ncbi:MAG: ABC transporter ATP-binding protein [Candidatus Brockarchaeota archaeon]|nr:ABC transporter ATP-binding protein [Candidatus Brockarchaeota archaeon]
MSGPWGAFSTRQEEERKRTVPDRVLLKRLYEYAKPFKKNLAIGIAAIVLSSVTGLAAPYMHKVAIDQIIQPRDLSGFLWWLPLFILVVLGNYFLQYVQVYQMRIIGENVVARIRDSIMERLQVISLRYFSEGEVGRILSRPVNDANTIRIFLRMGFTSILVDTSSILGTFVIMFTLNYRLAVLALLILPVAVIAVWFFGKASRKAYRRALSTLAGLTARMQEDLSGMKVIQAFVQEDGAKEAFGKKQDENVKANIRAILVSSSYQPMVILMRLVGTLVLLWYGTAFIKTGSITVGTLVAFIEYQFSYFMPLMDLIAVYDQYQSAMAATERLLDLVDTKVEVSDPPPELAVVLE